jgi:hypothetical protein
VQVLRAGADVAITPDGPRGPRHRFAPGALVVAYRAGAPHVSIVSHADRVWRPAAGMGSRFRNRSRESRWCTERLVRSSAPMREVSERTSEPRRCHADETERARMLSVSGSTSA